MGMGRPGPLPETAGTAHPRPMRYGPSINPTGIDMSKIQDFIAVFRLYRPYHGIKYAAQRAWDCAMHSTPF